MKGKSFSYDQPVRFPDVDHAGIAFFGALFTYCHTTHEEWLKAIGLPLHEQIGRGYGFPIVRVESNFESPARHGDVLRIALSLEKLGRKSMRLRYALHNQTTGSRVGVAHIAQVCTRLADMISQPIPDAFRAAVEAWNG